jgi:hypothetical protein
MRWKTFALIVWTALLTFTPMDPAEPTTEEERQLLNLARQKFGTLTEAEEKLFQAVAIGGLADYSTGSEEKDDPAKGDQWGQERVLRADRIAWLCTDLEASKQVTHKGVRVKGAGVIEELELQYARIPFPLYFEKVALPGGINLSHAQVVALYLPGTHTARIRAESLKIEGSVELNNGFRALGQVDLSLATIGGDLDCSKGEFINSKRDAIFADRVDVKGSVFLDEGFEAHGRVSLAGAAIGGQLVCVKGEFINPNGDAIFAQSVDVKRGVFMRDGFRARGRVSLAGAAIGGQLACTKGEFINPPGYALTAQAANVKRSVLLRDGFKAVGKVDLNRATIDGYFIWKKVASRKGATLHLRSARIGTLQDDQRSWPDKGKLFLHGLVYDEIAPVRAKSRIEWLRRQPNKPFRPQPYEQLAAVLRKSGYEEDAKRVLIAKGQDRVRYAQMRSYERCWHRLLGLFIGYGYRPWRAFWIGLAVATVGSVLFGIGFRKGLLTPTKKEGYAPEDPLNDKSYYPKFNALVYSFDAFVPLIVLHQASYWLPNANRGKELSKLKWFRLRTGGLLRLYLWFHIILGWVLSTLFVVGLSGLIRS